MSIFLKVNVPPISLTISYNLQHIFEKLTEAYILAENSASLSVKKNPLLKVHQSALIFMSFPILLT